MDPLRDACVYASIDFIHLRARQDDFAEMPPLVLVATPLVDLLHVPCRSEHGNSQETAYFLSGPKVMIDAFRSSLTADCGVAPENVLVDAWE